MTTLKVHIIYDPLCGWCYGAAPLVDALAAAGIDLRLHGGGLFPQPSPIGPDTAAYIRTADARIATITGQRFGTGYFETLVGDPTTVFWSSPPIAGVIAAEAVDTGAAPAMLHAIQEAHYVEGRRVVEPETLAAIAREIGLDGTAFDRAFSLEAAEAEIGQTRSLMRQWQVQGFPGFILETETGFARLPHERFYGQPAQFVAAVKGAARGRSVDFPGASPP